MKYINLITLLLFCMTALLKEVLSLNRDLFILEEDLLFPPNTQFSISLSMDTGSGPRVATIAAVNQWL